jgi:ribosome maturation factor RimP
MLRLNGMVRLSTILYGSGGLANISAITSVGAMLLTRSEIVELLSGMAAQHGLSLYDVDLPRGAQGVLRIFVCRGSAATSKITHSDCAALSKSILEAPQVEDILPGECQLEVSSPGVNRRLNTIEHFQEAVGERVLIKVKPGMVGPVKGILVEAVNEQLVVESGGERITVPMGLIKSAHVDFPFDSASV